MPARIEDSLLVVAPFKRDGVEYRVGDRLATQHRWVRRLAASEPSLFAMEYETVEVDQEWLAGLEAEAEARYQAAKRLKDGEAERRERALRQELKDQDPRQPELERRYRKQQEDQQKRLEKALEEREREALESQVTLTGGFNY